jgi:hypothetical protein
VPYDNSCLQGLPGVSYLAAKASGPVEASAGASGVTTLSWGVFPGGCRSSECALCTDDSYTHFCYSAFCYLAHISQGPVPLCVWASHVGAHAPLPVYPMLLHHSLPFCSMTADH